MSILVELKDASMAYGKFEALSNLNMTVARSRVVGIQGANGSGKTTLLRGIAGVTPLRKGKRISDATCAYIPATFEAPQLDAHTWLTKLRPTVIDPRHALQTLAFHGDLSRSCRSLSFGNLRKLMFAQAFSSDTDLIVIDEARAGLDKNGTAGLSALIDQSTSRSQTVIIADQTIRAFEIADEIWTIEDGRLLQNATSSSIVTATFRGAPPQMRALAAHARQLGVEQQ